MTQLPICAILDDYQNVALDCADWSALSGQITLRRYDSPLGNEDALATALADCSILVAMRERTAFPASLLARLPNLKLLITTGARNRSIDLVAAQNYGVTVCGTASAGTGAAELAWAGLLSFQRKYPSNANYRKRSKTFGPMAPGKSAWAPAWAPACLINNWASSAWANWAAKWRNTVRPLI